MKINTEKLYLTSSALLTVALISTSASATNPDSTPKPTNSLNNTTYTASGTMDRKMALMLTNLLRNPHLQVRAEINGQVLQTISPKEVEKNPINILNNYTITGKTERKTVLKLKKLLQNKQQLQISAEAIFNAQKQQKTPKTIMAYTPFYSNITPPTYIQGNTVWIPVVISKPMTNTSISQTPELVAAN